MLESVLYYLPTKDGVYELRGWFMNTQGGLNYCLFHSGMNEEFIFCDHKGLFGNLFCLHKGMKICLKDEKIKCVLRLF